MSFVFRAWRLREDVEMKRSGMVQWTGREEGNLVLCVIRGM